MALKPERRDLLAVSLAGTLLVVPWELFMTFGIIFSSRAHDPLVAWLFVLFPFLNVAAVLVSWGWPRVAGYWLLGNVTGSLVIGIGLQVWSLISTPVNLSVASLVFNE